MPRNYHPQDTCGARASSAPHTLEFTSSDPTAVTRGDGGASTADSGGSSNISLLKV